VTDDMALTSAGYSPQPGYWRKVCGRVLVEIYRIAGQWVRYIRLHSGRVIREVLG
jgi:hypothetical protein